MSPEAAAGDGGDGRTGLGRRLLRAVGRGRFARLLLPAIVLQSVLIGGGYATGREIVAYGAKFGALGWISIAVIFAGFALLSVLTFEFARTRRVYDYKRFVRGLIGPLWPLFDLLFGAMCVLVLAVMASAAGEIAKETLGIPVVAGTAVMVVAVGTLTAFGSRVIEAFKSVGTGLLYGAYLLFSVLVLARRGGHAWEVVARGDVSYAGEAGVLAAAAAGVLYVGYNLAVYPAVMFSLHRQTSRRHTLVSGLLSGALMTLPFALTYACVLGFYPDSRVLDAPVPWLPMLASVGGGPLLAAFGVVIGWTLLETSVGMIHAVLHRIESNLPGADGTAGVPGRTDGRRAEAAAGPTPEEEPPPREGGGRGGGEGLGRLGKGLIGAGVLAAAALLSRVGIVTLVAEGYSLMAYGFIALFALPLLTVGTLRIVRNDVLEPPSPESRRAS